MNFQYRIFSDGASRGNPGEASIGVACFKADADLTLQEFRENRHFAVFTISQKIGVTTNNVAEYQALISGLIECKNRKLEKVEFCLDSELVVKQMNGIYKVKDEKLRKLFLTAKAAAMILNISFRHVRREKNQIADWLANEAYEIK